MNSGNDETIFLAIEGGATLTRLGLYDAKGVLIAETEGRGSNPTSYGFDDALSAIVVASEWLLGDQGSKNLIVAAGLAGVRDQRDQMATALYDRLRARRVVVSNDVHPLLFANCGTDAGVLAIAGTGSSAVAQDGKEHCFLLGGRGEVIGDEGSAYQIAVSAIRTVFHEMDATGEMPQLAHALLESCEPKSFEGMVPWSKTATKRDIAWLAKTVCDWAEAGDAIALRCVKEQATHFATLVAGATHRVELPASSAVYVNGSLFERSVYRDLFTNAMRESNIVNAIEIAPHRGHKAMLAMATADHLPHYFPFGICACDSDRIEYRPIEEKSIDRMSAGEIVPKMYRSFLGRFTINSGYDLIERAVTVATDAVSRGGRVIYLGAGTSGRLGVLDASECPPTFGVDSSVFIGIIAGGESALRNSVENAEDDEQAAVNDLHSLKPCLSGADVVIGIAASGTTPYVLSGLREAKRLGARTVLLCCNPTIDVGADTVIAMDAGQEVLAGSSRLNAGTLTKIVLNIISTGTMALSGRIYDGYMVGVKPVNAKLRRRAIGIVVALTQCDEKAAEKLLQTAGDRVDVAVLMHRRGLSRLEAETRLQGFHGHLRRALDEP